MTTYSIENGKNLLIVFSHVKFPVIITMSSTSDKQEAKLSLG